MDVSTRVGSMFARLGRRERAETCPTWDCCLPQVSTRIDIVRRAEAKHWAAGGPLGQSLQVSVCVPSRDTSHLNRLKTRGVRHVTTKCSYVPDDDRERQHVSKLGTAGLKSVIRDAIVPNGLLRDWAEYRSEMT